MIKNSQIKISFSGWIVRLVLLLGLGVAGAACASSTVIPSQLLAVVDCDAAKVTITSVHWFKDSQGAWRVEGVITNNSSKAVSKVVTGVETFNKADLPADQGEDVSAYPLDLLPGAQAPFTAWIDREIPSLDHFKVEVNECVLTEEAERSQVEVHRGQMVIDDAGTAQVTAELVNPGSRSVLVNGLMAAVYDQAGALVAADYVKVATRYLAPGEKGPVRATLDLPPGGAAQIKSYKFFMDVLVNQSSPLPMNINHDVQIISHYTDNNGHFHLLGQITNSGSKGLMTSLQATVYAGSNKNSVVDAAGFTTWIPLEPGESLPFDLTEWGALNNTAGLWDELARQNAVIDLRIEPFLTWTAIARVGKLTLVDGNVSFSDQQAVFTGKVKNDMTGSISSGLVTAVVRQKSGGQIVATGSAHLAILDSAAPGQILDYSLVIPLPMNIDPASVETEVTAMGSRP